MAVAQGPIEAVAQHPIEAVAQLPIQGAQLPIQGAQHPIQGAQHPIQGAQLPIQGEGSASIDALWSALQARPDDAGLLLAIAERALAEEDLPMAHGFAQRAAERSTSPRAVLLLATILRAQGRPAAAADALLQRMDLGAHRTPGYLVELGRAQAEAGNATDACHHLHDALALDPGDAFAHHELAALYEARGDPRALAHRGAVQVPGTYPPGTCPPGAVSAAETLPGMADACVEALARDPSDFDALAMLAREELLRDRFTAAGSLYVRCLELDHERARRHIEAAIERLRLAAQDHGLRQGGDASGYQRRALLHHLLQQHDQAKTCYEQALMRDPQAAFPRAMLAALNPALGLPAVHDAFALDAAANRAQNHHELAERKAVLASTPVGMEVASTNVCNIDPPCVQCWKHVDPVHGWLDHDAKHLPRDILERIAPFVRRTSHVSLHGIGEPLANPHLFDTVRWCDDATQVSFVSNALLLNEVRIARVLDNRVALIDFSLDAGTPETFRKIRHNDFAKAVGNVRQLIAERDRRGLTAPRVCINMCLMRENVADIPAFVRLAHELEVEAAHLFHMNQGARYRFGWFDYEAQLCERDPVTHDRFVEEGFALANELGVHLHMSGRRRLAVADESRIHVGVAIDTQRFFCPKPWDSLLIHVDGVVANCCWQAKPIGNLHRQSIWEIWNGPLLQDVRRSTAAGVPHAACVSPINPCPYLGRT